MLSEKLKEMAKDFHDLKAQKILLEQKVAELSQFTKEVSLGKRNTNCLSCAEERKSPRTQDIRGSDNKVYKGAEETVTFITNRGPIDTTLRNEQPSVYFSDYAGQSQGNETLFVNQSLQDKINTERNNLDRSYIQNFNVEH